MSKRALIVGMGIGGMSAAIALQRQGWTPVLIERAPERRKGGYFIGLRDEGKTAAEALGVLDIMQKRTPHGVKFWDVRKDGRRKRIADLTQESNAPIAVLRGDIEEALWQALDGTVKICFGTSPLAIAQEGDQVRVTTRSTEAGMCSELYDLVVGADGVRSTVRKLVFGPDEAFFDPLGTMLCAFPLSQPIKGLAPSDGLMLADTGRALSVFPLAGRPSTALFSYRVEAAGRRMTNNPSETLAHVFAGLDVDGIIAGALEDLDNTDDFLFDSVQMVKMPHWSKGRMVLLGDAAWCLTLYSGMGASAGMMGGVALGQALATHRDDIEAALTAFEQTMRPFIRKNQRFVALRSQFFVPSSAFALRFRRLLWKILLLSRRWRSNRA